jgi:hypothetical protein
VSGSFKRNRASDVVIRAAKTRPATPAARTALMLVAPSVKSCLEPGDEAEPGRL